MAVPLFFNSINSKWQEKLKLAEKRKAAEFGDAARDAMRFYSEDHGFMFTPEYQKQTRSIIVSGNDESPVFQMTVNLVSNFVQLFLPYLYHRDPNRMATPRSAPVSDDVLMRVMGPQIQQMAQQAQSMGQQFDPASMFPHLQQRDINIIRAELQETMLNYSPSETNLRGECRMALTEALVKGMGCVYPSLREGDNGLMVPQTTTDSVDHILYDPDSDRRVDAKWFARRRIRPAWEIALEMGIPQHMLKPNRQSADKHSDLMFEQDTVKEEGTTADLIVYYEVYSRMGIGHRFSNVREQIDKTFGQFGDNVFLMIAPGHEFPLNLPPWLEEQGGGQGEIYERLQWPVPWYKDKTDPWPLVEFFFHSVPRQLWPMSHVTPAMGYQKLIDYIYGMLADRLKQSCRTLVVTNRGLEETLKQQITSGKLFELLELTGLNKDLGKLIHFEQFPTVNPDSWNLLSLIKGEWEDATGMNAIMHGAGGQRQMRSSAEAQIRDQRTNTRPDDMYDQAEEGYSKVAKKEAQLSRYTLRPIDVAPIFGEEFSGEGEKTSLGGEIVVMPMFTQLWDSLVHSEDFDLIVAETEYRVEAGSSKRPNREKMLADNDAFGQQFAPMLMQFYQGTGNPTPLNAFISQWAKARDYDAESLMLPDMQQQQQQALPPPEGEQPQEQPA